MSNIEEIKAEIFRLEKTAEIGIQICKQSNDYNFLHDAVFFSSEAEKWRRFLKEEYGVAI